MPRVRPYKKKTNKQKKNDKKTPQCGLEDWFPPRRSAPTAQSPPTALWASPSFRAGSARPSTGVALAPQLRSLPPPAELTSFCRAHGIPFPESRALPGPRLGGSSLSLCLPESRTLTTPGSEKSLRRIVELRLAPCLQKKKPPSGSAVPGCPHLQRDVVDIDKLHWGPDSPVHLQRRPESSLHLGNEGGKVFPLERGKTQNVSKNRAPAGAPQSLTQ